MILPLEPSEIVFETGNWDSGKGLFWLKGKFKSEIPEEVFV